MVRYVVLSRCRSAPPCVREKPARPFSSGRGCRRPCGRTCFETAYYAQAYPDVAASGLNPLTHFVLVGRAEGWRSCALPSPGTSAAEDIQRSLEAYETLVRRARKSRLRASPELVVSPPAMIRLSPQGDLSSHTRDMVLRAEESPDVSIVIPVFNNVRLTLECLLSIVEGSNDVPFEVIVVDNGSTDATTGVARDDPEPDIPEERGKHRLRARLQQGRRSRLRAVSRVPE